MKGRVMWQYNLLIVAKLLMFMATKYIDDIMDPTNILCPFFSFTGQIA